MKEQVNELQNSGQQEPDKKLQEVQRKSIPALVFLNYFVAINYHIQHSPDKGLQHLPFFRQQHTLLDEQEREAVAKMLLNCWSTEWALRTTAQLGDKEYLSHALHWTFPQAFHAIYAGVQAFLFTMGVKTRNADVISRELNRLVVRGVYPRAVGYYATGPYPDFKIQRLPMAGHKAALNMQAQEVDAQAHIGQFLRTTRKLKALAVRKQVQGNSQTALCSPKTGKVLEKWNQSHWQQIGWRLGHTTIFDLLGRLRISSSHKEIDRFVEADIDFRLFHQSLLNIVSYLNGVHEAYVARAMGLAQYQQLVAALPAHLKGGFVEQRLQEQILPLLNQNFGEAMENAA